MKLFTPRLAYINTTANILNQLDNDVEMTSKRRFLSLIFILKLPYLIYINMRSIILSLRCTQFSKNSKNVKNQRMKRLLGTIIATVSTRTKSDNTPFSVQDHK